MLIVSRRSRQFAVCHRRSLRVGCRIPRTSGQMRHVQEEFRLAGLRDHADEDADFGIVADSVFTQTL